MSFYIENIIANNIGLAMSYKTRTYCGKKTILKINKN